MSTTGGSSIFAGIDIGKGKNKEFVIPLEMDKKKTIRTGRGGAGNYAAETVPAGPAEPKRFRVPAGREVAIRTRRPTGQKSVTTGRGGSGNNKRVAGKGSEGHGPLNLDPHEVAVLKFNQAQLKERSVKSGRGGVGNITSSPENSTYARTIESGVQSMSSDGSTKPPRLFGRKPSLTTSQSSSFILTPLESINSRSTSISRAYTFNEPRAETPMSVQTGTDVSFANPRASLYGLPQSPSVPNNRPAEHIQMKTFSATRKYGEGPQGLPEFPEPPLPPPTPTDTASGKRSFAFPEPKTPRSAAVVSPTGSIGSITQWHLPGLGRKASSHHRPGTSSSTVTDWSTSEAPMTREERDILSVKRGLKMAQVFGEDCYFPDLTDHSQPLSHSRSADALRRADGFHHSPNSSQSVLGHYPSSSTSSGTGNMWSSHDRGDTIDIRGPRSPSYITTNHHQDEEYGSPVTITSPPPQLSLSQPTSTSAIKSRRRASVVLIGGGGLPSPVHPGEISPVKEKKTKLSGAISRIFKKAPVVQLQQPDWNDFTEDQAADVLSRLRNL